MSDRMKNVLLTVLAAVLLLGYAMAVPSGRLTDEADQFYHDLQRENDEDNDWLYNFGAAAYREDA